MWVSHIAHPAVVMSSNNLHGILNSKQVCFYRPLGKCSCPVDFVHFDCRPCFGRVWDYAGSFLGLLEEEFSFLEHSGFCFSFSHSLVQFHPDVQSAVLAFQQEHLWSTYIKSTHSTLANNINCWRNFSFSESRQRQHPCYPVIPSLHWSRRDLENRVILSEQNAMVATRVSRSSHLVSLETK